MRARARVRGENRERVRASVGTRVKGSSTPQCRTGAARSSPCAEPPSEPCDWSRCPIPCAERSVEAVSLESDDSERRKMGTGGVPAAAVTVVSPSGESGIHGPSRKPARRAVSLPIISVSWRRESESFTACHANDAELRGLGRARVCGWHAPLERSRPPLHSVKRPGSVATPAWLHWMLPRSPRCERGPRGRPSAGGPPGPSRSRTSRPVARGQGEAWTLEGVGVGCEGGQRIKIGVLTHARRATAREHARTHAEGCMPEPCQAWLDRGTGPLSPECYSRNAARHSQERPRRG